MKNNQKFCKKRFIKINRESMLRLLDLVQCANFTNVKGKNSEYPTYKYSINSMNLEYEIEIFVGDNYFIIDTWIWRF
jgi:hypothetical protein